MLKVGFMIIKYRSESSHSPPIVEVVLIIHLCEIITEKI